jgi:hypothetical protein
MIDIVLNNIFIFLLIWNMCFLSKKTILNSYTFNTSYYMQHFIINCIITRLCFPYFLTLFTDPFGIKDDYKEYLYIQYTYPILASLHTYHLYNCYKHIKYDEFIHHILTYIFWIIQNRMDHPFYYVSLIWMSGVPGGLTYLMLFLQKNNIITSLQEKYYSMLLNIWVRAPGCIIYSTLLYVRMNYLFGNSSYMHLFLIFFTMINGIHFSTTIIDSYYRSLLK